MPPTARRLILLASAAFAQPADAQIPETPATQLDVVGVAATREPRTLNDTAATVSVIDQQELDRRNVQTPSEAVRYEPGVSVGNQPARGGATNYVIRGIGDNRVRVQIDNIRVPDFPGSNIGAGTYTRDFVDLENVKRIEIVRGPASALYGSDAVGGVVAYTTKDPSDYFTAPGRMWYGSQKLAYDGVDNSLNSTTTAAVRVGQVEAMVLYTRRVGNETRSNGGIPPNPQTFFSDSVLGKIVYRPTAVDTLRLTGEFSGKTLKTDIRTDESVTPGAGGAPGTAVLASHGDDHTERKRVSLEYVHDAPVGFVDRIEARAYYTGLYRSETTQQYRSSFSGAVPVYNRFRDSDFQFKQDIAGGEVQMTTRAQILGTSHVFTYGGTLDVISTSRPRFRTETNLVTGAVATTVGGETYPNKNFPDTDTIQAGAYIQDEITWGRLTLTPAVRLDYYHLDPKSDALFANSNSTGFTINKQTDVAASPKLGVLYRLNDELTVFGQYAHGFRAPPYDTTNFGFTNRAFGYQILPNGNLKPETSDGVELGLRGRFAGGHSFAVTGFYNRFSDFIDTAVVGNAGGLTQFQYRNVGNVAIYGFEARGQYRLNPSWAVVGAFAYARGENKDTGRSIDSVDPAKLVAGLRYEHPAGFGAELNVIHGWRHNRVSDYTYFQAPQYTTLDAIAYYELKPSFTVNFVALNLNNERYFNTQDVIGLSNTNPNRGLYAQPGRTFGINTTVRF